MLISNEKSSSVLSYELFVIPIDRTTIMRVIQICLMLRK